MKCFRWLHLTDLHWGSQDHKDYWGTIQPGWFKDIDKLQEKCGGTWDAVFFTGDLVNKGKEEEFTALTERLNDLFHHLKSKGSEPHLFVVPGNHDLLRPKLKNSDFKMLTKYWEAEEDVRNAIWRRETGSGYWKIIQKAFENFTRWYAGAAKQFNVPGALKPGLLPGEFSVTLTKDSSKIGVLGLNTAFLQLDEGDFEGKLDAHPAQVIVACGELHQQWVEKHDACLLLSHHPMNWLSSHGQEEYKGVIAPSGRFALHLCGHQHEAAMLEEMLGGAAAGRRFLCGNSIFGMEKYTDWKGDAQKDRRHGYSAGSIDFSGEQPVLRIWPRRMEKRGSGVWGFNADNSFELEDDCIKPIPFESSRKKPPPAVPERPKPRETGEETPSPSEGDIKEVVNKNICRMLEKRRLSCFRSALGRLMPGKSGGAGETGHMADALLGMGLLDAIIHLQKAVKECIEDLKDDGSGIDIITLTWNDCVTILGWLVLTGVTEEWACKAALELARKGAALELMIPVETEVGVDIAVSRLNQVKAKLNLDERSMEVTAGTRIPSEKWRVESGWSLDQKVLTVKQALWKQLNRVEESRKVTIPEKLDEDLNQMLFSRRRMGENPYVVANLPGKENPYLDEEVYRALMADLKNLDIFYLGTEGEEGVAILGETRLQAQIREFLLIKTTIRTDK
jgi:predicted MPP superfamily phosphohydrolase